MIHNIKCHCGAVELEVNNDLDIIKQCNCSICKRKNAKMAMVPKDSISIIKGRENLSSYKFNTMVAEHFFCKICGIYTHHKMRSNPNMYGINAACIEGVDPYNLDDIELFDGINHPLDKKN